MDAIMKLPNKKCRKTHKYPKRQNFTHGFGVFKDNETKVLKNNINNNNTCVYCLSWIIFFYLLKPQKPPNVSTRKLFSIEDWGQTNHARVVVRVGVKDNLHIQSKKS